MAQTLGEQFKENPKRFIRQNIIPILLGLMIGLGFLCFKIWMMYKGSINNYNELVDLYNACQNNISMQSPFLFH